MLFLRTAFPGFAIAADERQNQTPATIVPWSRACLEGNRLHHLPLPAGVRNPISPISRLLNFSCIRGLSRGHVSRRSSKQYLPGELFFILFGVFGKSVRRTPACVVCEPGKKTSSDPIFFRGVPTSLRIAFAEDRRSRCCCCCYWCCVFPTFVAGRLWLQRGGGDLCDIGAALKKPWQISILRRVWISPWVPRSRKWR